MNDTHNKSLAIFTPSGCLTGDALSQFVAGKLSDSELAQARQHIAECPLCADAADGLKMWLIENDPDLDTDIVETRLKKSPHITGKNPSVKDHPTNSTVEVMHEFHVRTGRINQRVKQRLHAHALAEAAENKRLSYKPFVWISAAAVAILFIGSFFVIWVQNQSDRNKLALKEAQQKKMTERFEDSLSKIKPDTVNIYVLAMNEKSLTGHLHSLNIVSAENEEVILDSEIMDMDELPVDNSLTRNQLANEGVQNEIASSPVAGLPDSSGISNANTPVAVEGVVVTALGISREKRSMGYSVEDKTEPKVGGISVKESRRFSKKEKESESPVFTLVEEMPYFPGGEAARNSFLAENIVYPKQAVENGIQGTVYVQFIVDSKGNIADVKIIRGIGGGCDEEAMRVVKLMPRWKPGKQNGKAVKTLFNMPVYFKLTN